MTASNTSHPFRRRAWLGLLCICALASLLRLYHVWAGAAISPDGGVFIEYARRMGENFSVAVQSYDQHPLYPLLILAIHKPFAAMTGDGPYAWIRAGQFVALLGSLGAILTLYWFTTRFYGRRRALIAALMLAVLPDACHLGADVLTDMPHLALYFAGLAAALTGLQTKRSGYLSLAGVLAGLAFLMRPEGGAVLLVGVVGVLARRGFSIKKRIGQATAMIVLCFCVTAPYQLATGKFIPKKSPTEWLNLGSAGDPGAIENRGVSPIVAGDAVYRAASFTIPLDVVYQWGRAGGLVYVLLGIFGVCVARPRGSRALVLGLAAGIHVLLMIALEYRFDYLDRRHALVLATLALIPAAAGAWRAAELIGRRFSAGGWRFRDRCIGGILVACFLATSYWVWRPINRYDAFVVTGGRWLAANTPSGTTIIGDDRLRRVALYADRPFVQWRWWEWQPRRLRECLNDNPRSYFVIHDAGRRNPEKKTSFIESLSKIFGERLELVHTEQTGTRGEFRVYRDRGGR